MREGRYHAKMNAEQDLAGDAQPESTDRQIDRLPAELAQAKNTKVEVFREIWSEGVAKNAKLEKQKRGPEGSKPSGKGLSQRQQQSPGAGNTRAGGGKGGCA